MSAWHQRIRAAREDLGMTLTAAARELGLSSGALSKYERGIMVPSYHTGRDIDAFYGIGCDRCMEK